MGVGRGERGPDAAPSPATRRSSGANTWGRSCGWCCCGWWMRTCCSAGRPARSSRHAEPSRRASCHRWRGMGRPRGSLTVPRLSGYSPSPLSPTAPRGVLCPITPWQRSAATPCWVPQAVSQHRGPLSCLPTPLCPTPRSPAPSPHGSLPEWPHMWLPCPTDPHWGPPSHYPTTTLYSCPVLGFSTSFPHARR